MLWYSIIILGKTAQKQKLFLEYFFLKNNHLQQHLNFLPFVLHHNMINPTFMPVSKQPSSSKDCLWSVLSIWVYTQLFLWIQTSFVIPWCLHFFTYVSLQMYSLKVSVVLNTRLAHSGVAFIHQFTVNILYKMWEEDRKSRISSTICANKNDTVFLKRGRDHTTFSEKCHENLCECGVYEGIHFPWHMDKKCGQGPWKTCTGSSVHHAVFPLLPGRQNREKEKDHPGYSKELRPDVVSPLHRSGLRESCQCGIISNKEWKYS